MYQDLNIELIEDNEFDFDNDERWFSPIDRTLRRELKSRFNSSEYWFDTISYKELLDATIENVGSKPTTQKPNQKVQFWHCLC